MITSIPPFPKDYRTWGYFERASQIQQGTEEPRGSANLIRWHFPIVMGLCLWRVRRVQGRLAFVAFCQSAGIPLNAYKVVSLCFPSQKMRNCLEDVTRLLDGRLTGTRTVARPLETVSTGRCVNVRTISILRHEDFFQFHSGFGHQHGCLTEYWEQFGQLFTSTCCCGPRSKKYPVSRNKRSPRSLRKPEIHLFIIW